MWCVLRCSGPAAALQSSRSLFSNKTDSGCVPACGSVSSSQHLPWQVFFFSPDHHTVPFHAFLIWSHCSQLFVSGQGASFRSGAASSWHSRLTASSGMGHDLPQLCD